MYVAIVDYGMGNLFSVMRACEFAGLKPVVTAKRTEIENADAVILPGVGAFGDAMKTLQRLELPDVLRSAAKSGKPLVGVCLGMQLLMGESHEFGRHEGLGILSGDVVRLDDADVKVPQVGWNQITPAAGLTSWDGTLLAGLTRGDFMYFVHSYYVRPSETGLTLATTQYGSLNFVSAIGRNNVFACQFHPERSGTRGLLIYQNLAKLLQKTAIGATS